MIKQIRIVLSLIICFVFVGAMGTVPTAQAAPNIPPQPQLTFSKAGDVASITATENDTAATTSHWTLEARQAAKPLEVNISATDFYTMESADTTGAAVFKPGEAGAPAALEDAKTKFPDAWAAVSKLKAASNLPTLPMPSLVNPAGTKNVGDGYAGSYWDDFYLTYPYQTIGRLYFEDPLGYDYWCTAALIGPNNVIVTAAHCIYNTDYNFPYKYWYFQPADYDGYDPLGWYDWHIVWINALWVSAKNSSKGAAYDVGVIKLYGYPDYYGHMGWGYNWNPKNLRHTIGYTTNWMGAEGTWICVAESFAKGSLIGGGCGMNNTAGGSPSILAFFPYVFNTDYYNWVDAVVFGGADGKNIYSTRFTNKNILAICILAGC